MSLIYESIIDNTLFQYFEDKEKKMCTDIAVDVTTGEIIEITSYPKERIYA